MPPLPNPRHEKAAQLRANGELAVDAHEQVYGKRSKASASTLFKRPDVAGRVVELQEQRIQNEVDTTEHALKQLGITKKWWLGNLKLNAERCLLGRPALNSNGEVIPGRFTAPDVHGFNRSMELIGRAMGVFIDRLEIGNPGDFARLTDAELRARVEADAQALGMEAEATEALLLTFQPSDDTDSGGSGNAE